MQPAVVFIHGISNHPDPGVLSHKIKRLLGRQRGTYSDVNVLSWSDLYYPDYAKPESNEFDDLVGTARSRASEGSAEPPLTEIELEYQSITRSMPSEAFQDMMPRGMGDEIVQRITRPFLRVLAREVEPYFQDQPPGHLKDETRSIRSIIHQRFVKKVMEINSSKVIIIAHSFGSVIAIDSLLNSDTSSKSIALLSIGSPLGSVTIQSRLSTKMKSFPIIPGGALTAWVNLHIEQDLVSMIAPRLERVYLGGSGERFVIDLSEPAHSMNPITNHRVINYFESARFGQAMDLAAYRF